jgi:hypothetical protein
VGGQSKICHIKGEFFNGLFDFNKTPLGLVGCRVLIHAKPATCCSWDFEPKKVFTSGPSLIHIVVSNLSKWIPRARLFLLQTHGMAPNSKQEGIVRMLCKNTINGFNNRISGNQKIAKALDIKEDLDIDCLLYCKHRLSLCHKSNVNDFKQMFQREIACTAVATHNIHKWQQAGRVQEGRTGAICSGDATGYIRKVGKDEEGLGRWSWILLRGSDGHMTRLVMVYNPCKSGKANSDMLYQQQRRHFILRKQDLMCPRTPSRPLLQNGGPLGRGSSCSWTTTSMSTTECSVKHSATGRG